MSSLHDLAAQAHAVGDRLLHASSAQDLALAMPTRNILVTPAPLCAEGPDGPLFGVPVTVKDSYHTAGLRSTAGHLPLADNIPDEDAALVAKLRATGAVILGKTNLAELCGDVQTNNPIFGRTDNPWDASRTAGGSGGGGAAAVALGLSRLDLGSDLAGSLRIPASFCGVAVLKTSQGRLPMEGHIPALSGPEAPLFGTGGFIARDAADLAEAWHAMTSETATTPAHRLSLAYVGDFGLPLCPRSNTAMGLMQQWLQVAGHSLSPVSLDHRAAWRAYGILLTAAAAPTVTAWQRALLHVLRWMTPRRPIRGAMLLGLTGASPQAAKALQTRVSTAIDAILADHDALLCPVAATAAFPHTPKPRSYFASRRIDSGGNQLPYLEASIGFTSVFSLTGHPVVVVPVDVIQGLPIGIQIIMRHGDEARLLALATALETAFAAQRPPLWQSLAVYQQSITPHRQEPSNDH